LVLWKTSIFCLLFEARNVKSLRIGLSQFRK
jgi:hypothetical protein